MIDTASYCREIETYLCRKNEGHLIRIVGPAFAQVSGWAEQGVPLTVAFRGIDRFCERYYAKGPRRRPVRIEFCEPDILELFDDWRRAVGVPGSGTTETSSRKDSLPAHLDRVINRLTMLRAGDGSSAFDQAVRDAVRELDASRASARQPRGEARASLIERLGALDRELIGSAENALSPERRATLRDAAEAEVAPFAGRMDTQARVRAVAAAYDRLVREATGLPILVPEP